MLRVRLEDGSHMGDGLVEVSLGNPDCRQVSRDGIDGRIDSWRAHRASSRIVMAPDLLRLASIPCPKALETSSSTRLLIETLARRALDRRRLNAWEAGWRASGPLWTGRRG